MALVMKQRFVLPASLLLLWGGTISLHAQQTLRFSTMSNAIAQIESTSVDFATVPGRAILLTGQNTNIAKARTATVRYTSNDPSKISSIAQSKPSNLTDEIIASNNFLQLLPGQEGTRIMIDLGAIRLVNRVETYTHIRNSVNNRIRAYSLYTSLDSLAFRRVKQVADNQETYTVDIFTPDTARYVAIIIDKQDRLYETIVSEIKIYAVGFLSGGVFMSKVQNLGSIANVGEIRWWAQTPAGTNVRFQVRTGRSGVIDASWSPWSDEIDSSRSLFSIYEPAQFVQFRATLNTQLLETPQLDSMELEYDTLYVAETASARMDPATVEILSDSRVTYEVSLVFDGRSRGIDSLVILAPLPIVVTDALLNGNALTYGVLPSAGRTAIGFSSTISTSGTLRIGLHMTPVLTVNRFPSSIVSNSAPGNPQSVSAIRNADGESWDLKTTGIPNSIISAVTADPNPFTPNGDGINDVTHFSFFVTNLLEPKPVRFRIYDITGRLVKTLYDNSTAAKGFVEGEALIWNGTNDDGTRLPPGLYLFQIIVETDGLSHQVLTKTVTIAY